MGAYADAGRRRAVSFHARVALARAALVGGGLAGLVLTPTFASAYFDASGSDRGESAPGCLDHLVGGSPESGPHAVSAYEHLGVVYGFAALAAAVALFVVVGDQHPGGGRERTAWRVICSGLSLVAAGSLSEYGSTASEVTSQSPSASPQIVETAA
jgi:hypothetical protein